MPAVAGLRGFAPTSLVERSPFAYWTHIAERARTGCPVPTHGPHPSAPLAPPWATLGGAAATRRLDRIP